MIAGGLSAQVVDLVGLSLVAPGRERPAGSEESSDRAGRATGYVDGVEYNRATRATRKGDSRMLDHRLRLLRNVAVGGGWPGHPDSSSTFPQTVKVVCVRVSDGRGQT
ncbi:hypothetical protein JOF29_002865 [Kribbella aluminosa]|uniref:Uncharacterized protein n=1 Tax=Kribbella aluminosa TaxID=416017 RepID=A0ABS4UJE9_9ACTN|nr:hypothetical protein [Kribbella aluminosa]MBP2351782.1 hypothetical protein [Kribbella aluminosa]